jgi:hypothetical protein
VQILSLWPYCGIPELQGLVADLAMALPDRLQLLDQESAAPDPCQTLLLPYLPPHRLLALHGASPETLTLSWRTYDELGRHHTDTSRSAPSLPVNLERLDPPQLVGWLLNPSQPFPAQELPAAPQPEPLAALLTQRLLGDQSPVLAAYAALDLEGEAYFESLELLCSPAPLLAAFSQHRQLEADLAEQQHRLEQERSNLGHLSDDHDLLARQLNELHAGFETFHEKASSDAGKLDWNRKRREELELTLKLQQKDLEDLARQVRDQSSLIQRSAAASGQMMQLLAAALAD